MFDLLSIPAACVASAASIMWLVLAMTVFRSRLPLRAASVFVSCACAALVGRALLSGVGYTVHDTAHFVFVVLSSASMLVAAYCVIALHYRYKAIKEVTVDDDSRHHSPVAAN